MCVCTCQGRGRCIVAPAAAALNEEDASPSLDHPEHLLALVIPVDLPLLLSTGLSPSFPCESIVRSRGAPWLGLGTIRGQLLVGEAGVDRGDRDDARATTESADSTSDNGVRRSTNPYIEGAFVSFSPFPRRFLLYPGLHYVLHSAIFIRRIYLLCRCTVPTCSCSDTFCLKMIDGSICFYHFLSLSYFACA